MMPNVVRGDRMGGLLAYLVGPGRRNEHEDPHLVAGDAAMMAWHSDNTLDGVSAQAIARHLDRPRKALDVEVKGGHVWHCSLSLRAEEGMQTDQKWADIAADFVKAMDFDDPESPKAPCRWVAVRHGVSQNGNDHIHIVVNLVREDGTKAYIHNDFATAQKVARALEVRHGLEQLESVKAERATRGYKPGEREAQARAKARGKYERTRTNDPGAQMLPWEKLSGKDRQARIAAELRSDEPRYVLALKVRGAAAASADEAEFVRRMRRSGLIVRPRYAEGTTDVITGYSVAQRPTVGERPIWYGGGTLARDLRLSRLREHWPDSPQGAGAAAAEWNAAGKGRRVVAPGREAREVDPQQWQDAADRLGEIVAHARSIPVDDYEQWATLARHSAGTLAAWSNATEAEPGELAGAAEALSRSAQTYQQTRPLSPRYRSQFADAAMVFAASTRSSDSITAQVAMIRHMLRLTQAVHGAARAQEQARQAKLLATRARAELVAVRDRLPAPERETLPAVPATRVALDADTKAVLERVSVTQAHPARDAVRGPLPSTIQPKRTRTSHSAGKPEIER
ncbi:relaxase/mobilization nuclease domain-containing protein [Dermabacter hominis]|jgi:hypothetical protein|nr:relaxase/mobilization nuclease domain-containing protein [Dermabacter hominis]